jgi:hypothetical protein
MFTSSNSPVELDFFYPQFNLAVEYQVRCVLLAILIRLKGEQHYQNAIFHRFAKSLESEKQRDDIKSDLCAKKGYW